MSVITQFRTMWFVVFLPFDACSRILCRRIDKRKYIFNDIEKNCVIFCVVQLYTHIYLEGYM